MSKREREGVREKEEIRDRYQGKERIVGFADVRGQSSADVSWYERVFSLRLLQAEHGLCGKAPLSEYIVN